MTHTQTAMVMVDPATMVTSLNLRLSSFWAWDSGEGICIPVQFASSAVVIPLVSASGFFPFTVGGAGVREAAFAALYGTVGVPEATAYAGSLSFWAMQLVTAGVGGLINLWIPVSGGPDDR